MKQAILSNPQNTDTAMKPAPEMTITTPSLPTGASRLRRVIHAFALDDWFRVVSFPGGAPDRREIWRQGGISLLWFLAAYLGMYGGYYLLWPIFLFVPFAGWKMLRHWSLTFYMRLRGTNRWLFTNYARAFAGFVRVFAVLWVFYLLSTPIRPFSAEAPLQEVRSAARPADPVLEKVVGASLPNTAFYSISRGNDGSVLGRGIVQILRNPFSSFLFGCDHAAQRHIAEARRAWNVAILIAPPEKRAALRRQADAADLAHPVLGRGGLPHLLDHWCFGARLPLATEVEQ